MAGDTIYRDGNWWQAIRYTEMGSDDKREDIKDGKLWQAIRCTEMGTDGR